MSHRLVEFMGCLKWSPELRVLLQKALQTSSRFTSARALNFFLWIINFITVYWARGCLSMLGLKLIHVSKRGTMSCYGVKRSLFMDYQIVKLFFVWNKTCFTLTEVETDKFRAAANAILASRHMNRSEQGTYKVMTSWVHVHTVFPFRRCRAVFLWVLPLRIVQNFTVTISEDFC